MLFPKKLIGPAAIWLSLSGSPASDKITLDDRPTCSHSGGSKIRIMK